MSRDAIHPFTGTLNLLLANRNGFVIASDSRRTQLVSGSYFDDSQKLFRIGPKSAMVIAGFATWIAQGSPLDVQVASILREVFNAERWTSGKLGLDNVSREVDFSIGSQLGLLGALLSTNEGALFAHSLDFQLTAAEITSSGSVQILQSTLVSEIDLLGPYDLPVPTYKLNSTTTSIDSFVAKTAGLENVARAILEGTFRTEDIRILNYYRARTARELDDLPLLALEELAVAILEATNEATPLVGGPSQVGVFAVDGAVKWTTPALATDHQTRQSTILKVGVTYVPDRLNAQEYTVARGKKILIKMDLSLYQPFEQPITQVFVGNRFRGVTVSLDGNVFAGNRFSQVRFEYRGGRLFFINNSLSDCVVNTPPEISVPPPLRSCRWVQQVSVDSASAIGAALRAQPKGCVARNKEGKLILKTDGWENGKSCKDSGLIVPKFFP